MIANHAAIRTDFREPMLDTARMHLAARLEQARAEDDDQEACRLAAMKQVVDCRMIALAFPETVNLAGDAALAQRRGLCEAAWRKQVSDGGEPPDFDVATRILKAAGIWPWSR